MAMRAATTYMAAMVAAAAKPRGLSRVLFSSLNPDSQFSPSQEANESQSVTADSSPFTSTPTRSSNFSFTPPQPAPESQRVMADPSTNLFVSGLSKRTTDEGLRDAFAKFGEVVQARVVKDRNSGYSKGFGFVNYSSLEGAAAGIAGMDGKFLDGWVIFAEYARPRESQPPRQEFQSQGYGQSYGNSYGRR